VVSPLIEWLPSISDRYWITDEIPRVMTLDELASFLASRSSSCAHETRASLCR
jgi:hypothetical protein